MTTALRRTVVSLASDGDDHNGRGRPKDAEDVFTAVEEKELRLLFLGCEVLSPYGPYEHTAELFMDLIACAVSNTLRANHQRKVVLEVYGVSEVERHDYHLDQFPTEVDLRNCDGVILPGSFSSAYDEEKPWILALKDWIQNKLVAREIPTLGVCFGHQLYAQSFFGSSKDSGDNNCNKGLIGGGGGTAVKCPAGPQAGRKTTKLTLAGRAFLTAACRNGKNGENLQRNNDNANNKNITSLDLFYTHGDMVESLPSQGVSLGGNDKVPIQAALYFSTPVVDPDDAVDIILGKRGTLSGPKVIAVTFQAHPEFAALGKETKGNTTLHSTIRMMKDNGRLSEQDYRTAEVDAALSYMRVREQSLDAIISAGRLLGWFHPI